ncbi:PREDICTED: juvenile hormone acid O-methyltransferase-like [Nicrophorus vespilloides]|uniref:Juvenile hormone acid O-methyltransferase-like n=1 Tax=Nicrophorus vespilloides TaxID=110193 RepID=A0ABM1N0A7_NICVS|nr:PREDICTED: juvenile hormone acid O-methyltransferase-like [Nicrophorus vespilloides]
MAMMDPELYSQYHGMQRDVVKFFLKNYLNTTKWKSNDTVLDIGCGSGEATMEQLAPSLPQDFKKLVGLDICPDIVNVAKRQNKNPKIDFIVCDISSKDINKYVHEKFDHIFSFTCLQWVQNQRQAMHNIYNLLKPGGDIQFMFVERSPIYDIYESMASNPKWSRFMEDANLYISPYHHCEDPVTIYKNILVEEGFTVNECIVVEIEGLLPSLSELKKSLLAVNPFFKRIPESMRNDYVNDYIKEFLC